MVEICAIIVTYNGASWIGKCLDSLRTSVCPVEIYVVDNKSSDETCKIIERDYQQEVNLIRLDDNLGFGRANNIGLHAALKYPYKFVLLINQDASVQIDTIGKLCLIAQSRPNYFILSPIHLNGAGNDLDLNFLRYLSHPHTNYLLRDYLLSRPLPSEIYEVPFVNAAIWLLPATVFTIVGGFDDIFEHYGEDNDFVNRVQFHGGFVGICPNVFGHHDRGYTADVANKKQAKINRMAYIYIMKNVNKTTLRCLLQCCKMFIQNSILYTKQRRFLLVFFEMKNVLRTMLIIGKILRHRHLSKQVGRAFLKED